jgi:hypothetical protein
MVGGDDKKEIDLLKSIIGRKIVGLEIWGMDYSKNKWVKNHREGNVTARGGWRVWNEHD